MSTINKLNKNLAIKQNDNKSMSNLTIELQIRFDNEFKEKEDKQDL
jgi:hypothetical protein